MATIFSHSLIGASLAYLSPVREKSKTFVFWMAFVPIIPDFDYIGFKLRVPYGSFWGHRGFAHSLLFSLITASLVLLLQFRNSGSEKILVWTSLFTAIFLHPIVDAMTNGGLGVAFYSPYNLARYFFNWRPIQVSPMGLGFFSEKGLVVLVSECVWIVIPCAMLVVGKYLIVRIMRPKAKATI